MTFVFPLWTPLSKDYILPKSHNIILSDYLGWLFNSTNLGYALQKGSIVRQKSENCNKIEQILIIFGKIFIWKFYDFISQEETANFSETFRCYYLLISSQILGEKSKIYY